MEISTISYFSFGHCHLKYCVDSVASSRICWSVYICFEYVEASEVPYFVFYVHSVMSCGPYSWNKRNLKLNTNGILKDCCRILNEVNFESLFLSRSCCHVVYCGDHVVSMVLNVHNHKYKMLNDLIQCISLPWQIALFTGYKHTHFFPLYRS